MPQRRRQRRRRGVKGFRERAAFWLAWWLACLGLWFLLVFKTQLLELFAGMVAAAFAATAVELVRSRGYAPFAGEWRWLLALLRLPREVLVDCWLLFKALFLQLAGKKQIRGGYRVIHFESSQGEDPRSEARRAVAKWLGGVGPNSYVIGFDERHDSVLVHQLVRTEHTPEVDPGAKGR
jgi:hypothetical protein